MRDYKTVDEIEYRTIDEITAEYLRDRPDEIDDYIIELFDEYAQDGDIATLLSSLRIISRVKGVSFVAETSGLSRKGVQKELLSFNALLYRE